MSINNFEDFIRGEEFNKVIYEEYDFIEISKNNNTRILKRTNYRPTISLGTTHASNSSGVT